MDFLEIFRYDFVHCAFIAILMISFMCALLGNFLVLGKMSSLGDAVSHISFGAISVAAAISDYPFIIGLIFVIFSAVALDLLSRVGFLHGESAISIISLFGISIGIVCSSFAKISHNNTFEVLFGSALIVSHSDILLIAGLALIVVLFVFFLYKDFLFAVSRIQSPNISYKIYSSFCEILLKILVTSVIFCTARFLGTILVSSLLIVPASISMWLSSSFKQSLFISVLISIFISFFGLLFGLILNLPIGASVTFLSCCVFFLSFIFCGNIYRTK